MDDSTALQRTSRLPKLSLLLHVHRALKSHHPAILQNSPHHKQPQKETPNIKQNVPRPTRDKHLRPHQRPRPHVLLPRQRPRILTSQIHAYLALAHNIQLLEHHNHASPVRFKPIPSPSRSRKPKPRETVPEYKYKATKHAEQSAKPQTRRNGRGREKDRTGHGKGYPRHDPALGLRCQEPALLQTADPQGVEFAEGVQVYGLYMRSG